MIGMATKGRFDKRILILLTGLFLALLAILIFIPALDSGFFWDDVGVLNDHSSYDHSHPFTFFASRGVYYRPLIGLSAIIDHGFWHLNPKGYHLTNLLIHGLNVFLLFFVLTKLIEFSVITSSGDGSFSFSRIITVPAIGALIFAFHPINTESVVWISGRTDPLATMFFLLAFLCLILYDFEKKPAALILMAFFSLCSLFSKENALSFIGMAFVFGLLRKMRKKEFIFSIAVLLATTVFYFYMRSGSGLRELLTKPGGTTAFLAPSMDLYSKAKAITLGSTYYIEKLLAPVHLSVMPQIPHNPAHLLVLFLPLVLAAVLLIKGRKWELFFLLWVFITLSPSLSITISQIANPLAERYMYLPAVGFSALVALLLSSIPGGKKLYIPASCIVIILLGLITSERLKDWRDDFTIWADTVKKDPDSTLAHTNYGVALINAKNYAEAERELLIAYRNPAKSLMQTSGILNSLGDVELKKRQFTQAGDYFMAAIKADPRNVYAYNNIGYLHMRLSEINPKDKEAQLKKAIDTFKLALKLSPRQVQVYYNMGICSLSLNDYKKAEEYFTTVIEIDPMGEFAQRSLSFLLASQIKRQVESAAKEKN